MQAIWGLALIADALHLHTDGNHLAMSSSYCRTLSVSAQNQMTTASQSFPRYTMGDRNFWGYFEGRECLWTLCFSPQKQQTNSLGSSHCPQPYQRPHFWLSLPLCQYSLSTINTLLPIFIGLHKPLFIFPFFS
jgi:hypothetical protein